MLPLLSATIYLLIRSLNGVNARAVNTAIISLPISDISSPILADSVNAATFSQRCGDIDNCRTLDDIVRSCLVTIVTCAWFAVHRNLPAPKPKPLPYPVSFVGWVMWVWRTVWSTVRNQKESLVVFLVAFLAPEWVLGWAMRQAMLAWKLSRELEAARLKVIRAQKGGKAKENAAEIAGSVDANLSTAHAPCQSCEGNANECNLVAGARRVAKGDECWTWLHGFFVAMGGFWYDKDGPLYPLSPDNVLELVKRSHLVPPTADEISDRSKGDWLSKGVAIGQTVWFVVQCIARRVEGLPITRLEVMTLAYTVITVAMYVVWWKKPLNVSCAVRVPKEKVKEEEVTTATSNWETIGAYVMGNQDEYVDLRGCKGVPTFWSGDPDSDAIGIADIIAILVAMAFGAVHCIAWHSEFQSHLEQKLWRSSAIAIIAVPPALSLPSIGILVVPSSVEYSVNINGTGASTVRRSGGGRMPIMFPLAGVYITARVILIIFSFTSIRGLPYAAYETVQWTTFVPHI